MGNRINKVRELLKKFKVDAVLISSVPNIAYLTGYFNFSIEEREAFLLITEGKQYIFTDTRYSEAIEKQVKNFKLIVRSPALPFKNQLKEIFKKEKIKKIGFEEESLTFKEYKILTEIINNPVSLTLSNLRINKSQDEIEKIRKACGLGDFVFKEIVKQIKIGVSEKEVGFKIEVLGKERGADVSFKPIVAFGENSSVPHHETGNSRLLQKSGQFILLDFGFKLDGYCSDMTRTLFFGKPTDKQKLIYETVLKSQQMAIGYLKEMLSLKKKIKLKEIDSVARVYIKQIGFDSIPHSLGHGVGLEVHEAPRLSPKSEEYLEEGLVFSIEPGIYLPAGRQGIPGYGGVRIEDLFAIENNKLIQLTKSDKTLKVL